MTVETNSIKLQVLQNRVLRAVKKCPPDYQTKSLHNSLEIDYPETSRVKSTHKLIYRGVNNMGSSNLNNMFDIYEPRRQLT